MREGWAESKRRVAYLYIPNLLPITNCYKPHSKLKPSPGFPRLPSLICLIRISIDC